MLGEAPKRESACNAKRRCKPETAAALDRESYNRIVDQIDTIRRHADGGQSGKRK
jgi:hypothetical protein